MTKKDFELVAALLKYPPIDSEERDAMAKGTALTLSERYPSFNREKFLAACGVRP